MKKQTDTTFSNLSKEQTNALTAVVNETVAMDFTPAKSFTIVDWWNIQRKSKTGIGSRKSTTFF